MNKITSYEKILLACALILCAIIVGYNAFFVPNPNMPCIVYSDSTIDKTDTNKTENNEPEPNNALTNINTASAEELAEGISGVGEKIAERIIEYRNINGNFKDISEIKNVKGIGEKTFEKIKEQICV